VKKRGFEKVVDVFGEVWLWKTGQRVTKSAESDKSWRGTKRGLASQYAIHRP